MTSVARDSARSVVSLTAARAISFGLQFLTFALLAAHLGPRGFGVYTFGVAIARLLGLVTNFGLKQVVTRDAAQQPEAERWLLPNYLYLRIAAGFLGYALLVGIVFAAGYRGDERRAALVAGSLLVLMSIGSFSASLEIRQRLGWVAIADIAEACGLAISVLVLVARDASVLAFVTAYVAVNVLNGLIVLVAALARTTYAWRPRPDRWVAITRSAVPLGLAGVFSTIYWQTDIALLARMKSEADVGQYGAAYRVLDAAIVLPIMIMVVVGPVLSRSFVEGHAVLQRRYGTSVHLMTVIALPASVLGAMTAWRVLPALPGFADFDRGGIALSILAPAAGAIFVATLAQAVLVSSHRTRLLLKISATGALLNVALNLATIPAFSLYGSAAATTATEVAVLVFTLTVLRRQLDIRWPVGRLRPVLLATAIMAGALVVTATLHPFLQLLCGVVAYAVAVASLGGIRWTDLGGLLRRDGPTVEVAPGGVLATRAACRGAARCVIVDAGGRAPLRTALGARLAGCATVDVAPAVSDPRA